MMERKQRSGGVRSLGAGAKKLWLNLPIRTKIISYYFILIAVLYASLMMFSNNSVDILDQLNETVDNSAIVYLAMEYTSADVKDVEKYLFEDDIGALASYRMRKNEVAEVVDDLNSVKSSLESYFSISAIYYSVKAYNEYFENAIERKQAEDEFYYTDYYKGVDISRYTNRYFQDLLLEKLKEESEKAEHIGTVTMKFRKTSFNIMFIVSVLTLVLGIIISNAIVKPIKKLSQYSKEISAGKLDLPEIEIDSKEEIGDLSKAFNHMSKSIKQYIESIHEKANVEKKLHEEERAMMQMEQLLQQARLEALQAQINPHFLFNTLNVISRTAMFEEASETMDLIQRLSKILRYQLMRPDEKATILEDKMLILDYLALQKVRFKERLKFDIDIPDDIVLAIPVLTFQPLVENAIIHGIEPRINGGSIRIKARQNKERTIIKVIDTGIGMKEGTVNDINNDIKLDQISRDSIGIRNVKQRFTLTFSKNSQFIVQSKHGLGTMITMIIENEEVRKYV